MLRDTVFIYLILINVSPVDEHFHTVQYSLSARNYEIAKNLVNTVAYAFLIGLPFFRNPSRYLKLYHLVLPSGYPAR